MNDSPIGSATDIAIIGAGPYGLSLAAHLAKTNRRTRIFGEPMQSWKHHMPRGMKLKSEGFASSLYDPESTFPLRQYCRETFRHNLETVEDTPILSRNFESSVPNLYFIGLAAANSFGPLNRFACGAEFTAKHLTQHLS